MLCSRLSNGFVRPRPIPLIMSAGAVLLMFGLGVWQLQRLEWKEALIARIETANEDAPLTTLPDDPAELDAHRFYRVEIQGEYLPDSELHVAARYFKSQLGYHIFNPFRRIALVNRGWVPSAKKSSVDERTPPSGPQTLLVQIQTTDERNPFTPPNQPDENIWFGRDVAAMGTHLKLGFIPAITLDLIGEQDIQRLPVPSSGQIKLRNDHLGYAITWFGVGFSALVISLLYHRKKPENAA